jgi:hypothetical protein
VFPENVQNAEGEPAQTLEDSVQASAATVLPASLPDSLASLVTWLLLGGKTSFSMMGLSGLGGPSRWGGETALEVLGLGCSGELEANLTSFSSSDSILMIFLEHWVWQDFLFWGVIVLETSCAVGSHRARSSTSRISGQRPVLGAGGLWPHLCSFSFLC